MTTLTDRPGTALLVVDAQTGVLALCPDTGTITSNISLVVERARAADVPVVWVQHCSNEFPEGSDAWQVDARLAPAESEARVLKRYGDSFEGTELEHMLARLRIGALVVCGAMTDQCIRCTVHGAFARGYDVTLVGDAHTTEDGREWGVPVDPSGVIAFLNLMWENTSAPGRTAAVVPAQDVTFEP